MLATAATNGAVVVWDLEKKGQQKLGILAAARDIARAHLRIVRSCY